MYSSGIISPAADGKFRPADNITREEFIKLLAEGFFKEYIVGGSSEYTDSNSNAWYDKYLLAATNAGITTGKGDGSFGVGENITREDMVTMAARCIERFSSLPDDEEYIEFSDYESISSYAQRYVKSFVKEGIVNGMGDGSFSPKSSATRAQAAKIIAQLLKKYN